MTIANPSHLGPIPVTVLCGFLGSGKTTLLNALLRHPHAERIAVIVNEFGSVGVDGALIEGGAQFVELDNGCLCCALNEDLEATIQALLARGDFDRIVVETTGIADPLPVAWTFSRPGISQQTRVDAIVTVVDADALTVALAQSEDAAMQIKRADILVLNKLDLVHDHGKAAHALVRQYNDVAPIVSTSQGNVPFDFVFAQNIERAFSKEPASHPKHAHHNVFKSYTWQAPDNAMLDERRVEDFVYEIPKSIYRFKGFLHTNSDWGPWTLLNAVAGRIDLRPYPNIPTANTSYIVFIGRDLNKPHLRAMCDALVVAAETAETDSPQQG